MADDLQRLIVSLEANIKKYERELSKARGVADTSARRIESRFRSLNRGLSNEFASLARGFAAAFTVREIGRAVDQYTRIQNALRVAGLEGQALKDVYDQLFQAAQRNAAPLESLVQLYSRVSQVQGELNTNSGELIKFSEGIALAIQVSGKSAAEASGALLQLSQALAGGTVRAEEFNSITDGALPILQSVARGLDEAGGSVGKLRILVTEGKVSSEAFFRAFLAGLPELQAQAASTERTFDQAFTVLQNGFVNLIGQLDRSTGASSDATKAIAEFGRFLSQIAGFVESAQQPLQDLADAFNSIFEAAQRSGRAFNEFIGEGLGLNGPTPNLDRAFAAAEGSLGALQVKQPLDIGTIRPTVSIKDLPAPGKSGVGGGGSENEFQREIEQIRERTQALLAERDAVGLNTRESEKHRAVLDLEQAARRANVPLTEANRQKIEELAAAYADASATLETAHEQLQQMNELQQFIGGELTGFFSDIITGSGDAREALDRLVKSLADAAIQAVLLGQGPLAGLFGTSSAGGGVGGLFGGLFGGFRAAGGPVSAGKAYVVGERGRELFVPSTPGKIVPANSNRAGGVEINVINNARADVQASSQRGPDGRQLVQLVIAETKRDMAGGGFDSTMKARFPLVPNKVRR